MLRKKSDQSCFLTHLIFFITVAGSSSGTAGQDGCSSTCGSQSIKFPFRLQGDPTFCGVQEYELICNGNVTVLDLNPGKYYVTGISYENATLHLVDVNLSSGSRCTLPFPFPSLYFVDSLSVGQYFVLSSKENYQLVATISWAIFVNCSVRIQNETSYDYVPCLSGNNTFIYALYGVAGAINELLPTCSFVSEVPVDSEASGGAETTATDIFRLLQKGFTLNWGHGNVTRSQVISYCLRNAATVVESDNRGRSASKWLLYLFSFESKVLGCLMDYEQYTNIPFVLPVIVIVCLDIVILLLVISILIRFTVAPICIYVFIANEFWKTMVPIDNIEIFLRKQQCLAPTRYAYSDIVAMTSHFREKLGQGGFGLVYKGELAAGHLVAVKMLDNSKCNGEDFISEVSTIGRIHHLNVVRLVGFCSEGSKRALVYEFMPNGSLDKYIFSSNGSHRRFTVEKLNEIALGVARGIDYLHRGCDMRILHFDIKPHNILLDQKFNPRVSDFGLAKLYPKEYSLVSFSVARGTIGYIAPELVSRSFGVISQKSDVYSFGMLLMEMAGGRRNVNQRADNSSQVYYPSWIYDRLLQSEGPEICDSFEIDDIERKLCKVGLWCIQMRPSDRPSMSRVIEMLEADVQTLPMPPKPFLSTAGPVSVRQSCISSSPSELSIISEDEPSFPNSLCSATTKYSGYSSDV